MAIEIRELIVRATITNDPGPAKGMSTPNDEDLLAKLVSECVEQVIERLREQHER